MSRNYWIATVVVVALVTWFVLLPWVRNYRAQQKHRAQKEQ